MNQYNFKFYQIFKSTLSRKLSKDLFVYGLGSIITSVSSFLLLPFYIRNMSIEEFGLLTMVLTIPVFLNPLMTLSLESAVMRNYYDWISHGEEKKSIFTIWLFMMIWGVILGLIIVAFLPNLFNILLVNIPFYPYVYMAIILSYTAITYNYVGKILRIKEEPKKFILLNYIGTILKFSLILLFVVAYKMNAVGALYGILITDIIMLVPAFFILYKNITFSINFNELKDSLKLMIPALPGVFLLNFSSILDRFLLDKFFNITEIGIYSLSIKIASVVLLFLTIFQLGIIPYYIRIFITDKESRTKMNIINNVFNNFILICALFLLIFSPEIGHLLGKKFTVPIFIVTSSIIIGYYFQTLQYLPQIQFYLSKKLIYTTYSTIIQLICFVAFSLLLAKPFGIIGFSVGFLLSNFLVLIFSKYFGNLMLPINNDKFIIKLFFILLLYIGIVFTSKYFVICNLVSFTIKLTIMLVIVISLLSLSYFEFTKQNKYSEPISDS